MKIWKLLKAYRAREDFLWMCRRTGVPYETAEAAARVFRYNYPAAWAFLATHWQKGRQDVEAQK